MKKFLIGILIFSLFCSCAGCDLAINDCDHSWSPASCTEPEKCSLCGETQGTSLSHNYIFTSCTEPKECDRCGKTSGNAPGHDYNNGVCTRCSVSDPDYITIDDVFPGKPDQLNFYMNSAGGIKFYWNHVYTGKKKINYITVTYTLYDAVGNPTPDDIKNKSTNSVRLIGPFEPNQDVDFDCDVFVYCDVCNKVSFDTLLFEYADGTTASIRYDWQNTVR